MAKRFLIKESTAIKLFKALGFKTAGNWTTDRLQSKLNKLPEIADEDKVGEWVQGYLDRIEKADEVIIKEKDEDIMTKKKKSKGKGKKKEVVEEKVVDATKKSKKSEKKAIKTETKKSAPKKDAKKPEKKSAAVDKFGYREGSIKAQINAVLSKKAKTMKELQKDAKVKNPQTGHLNDLIQKKLVKKTDKGYKLI